LGINRILVPHAANLVQLFCEVAVVEAAICVVHEGANLVIELAGEPPVGWLTAQAVHEPADTVALQTTLQALYLPDAQP